MQVSSRSVFFGFLVVLAFGFALTIAPKVSAAATLSIQLSDHSCGSNAGSAAIATASGTASDWSGYAIDSNGHDADCAKVNLSGITEATDFRVGIQLTDGSSGCSSSEAGSQMFSPWASTGGGFTGWATDSNAFDPNCTQVYLETRPAPAGASIQNPSVEIQASDQACSAQLGSSLAGQWVADSNTFDFDCLRLRTVATVVPLGKVTVNVQAFDINDNLIAGKPSVSWTMSGPAGAPSCSGSNSTGKTCERMPYGVYGISNVQDATETIGVKQYQFIGLNPVSQQLGTTSPPAGVCPSGQTQPHLAYNTSGNCASVNSCGVSECSIGGGGGGGGGMEQQVNFLPKSSIFGSILKFFTREAEARVACEIDGVCEDEQEGPPLPTPPPPNDPPPTPTEIFFTIQYKEVASKTLTVTKTGTGSGTVTSSSVSPAINCGSICTASYPDGQVVPLSATAATGSVFVSWSGCNTVSGTSCGVTMSGDKTVTATFNLSTNNTPPEVTNPTATNITSSSATLGATLADAGSPSPTSSVGICYATASSALPSTGSPNSTCTQVLGSPSLVPITFTKSFTGLSAGTTYSYRGYATNPTGTGYSIVASFTTTAANDGAISGVCSTTTAETCDAGTYVNGTDTSTEYKWNCNGINNGANVACSMPKVLDGLCGSRHNACSRGTSVDTTDTSTNFKWSCNSTSGGANVACTESKYKELTAGLTTPTTAVVNVAKSFSSTISNDGSLPTGAAFPVMFQTSPSSTGASGVVDYRITSDMSNMDAYASGTAQHSITFPAGTPSTMYMRACADKSSATSTGVISETSPGSENNNCSAWRAVTVTSTVGTVSGTHDQYAGSVPASQCRADGWAAYSSDLSLDLNIRILSDGVSVATGTAGTFRQDLQTAGVCTGGTCGFYINLSGIISSGVNHSITVQAQNPGNSVWTNISSTPKTINCAAPLPDLTAGAITPVTATANTATTYSATITNTGMAAAVGTITHLFQFDEDTDHTGVNATRTVNTTNTINASGGFVAVTTPYTFITSGTKYVRACADNNASYVGTVNEGSGENNNCGAWTAIAVAAPLPDLTAGTITPATATANTAVTYSATITNNGGAAASGTITHLFQFDEDADHNAVNATRTVNTTSTIGASGGSVVVTTPYTFLTSGTKYIRACADANASMTGTVSEGTAGETNNCGAWTSIVASGGCTPPPAFRPGTSGFSPASVNVNGSVNVRCDFGAQFDSISPNFTGATGCTWGGFTGTVANYTCTASQAGTHTVYCNTFTLPPPGSNYCTTQNALAGSLTVVSAADLVAGGVSPASVSEGAATNFSATISNAGSASTGLSFPYFFQAASAPAGGGTITNLVSKSMSALAGSVAATASDSYTFADPGTFSMRVCADKTSPSSGGVITESDENNNCGAWTNITASEDNDPEDSIPSTIGVDSVTISAPTVKTDGTHYNITVVSHRKSGGGALNNQYALINMQGGNAGAYRGFITWYRLSDAWPTAQNKQLCSGVGGYAVVQNQAPNDVYGQQYVRLDSCNVSDSAGGVTTAIFTVHFTPLFTSPASANDISGLTCDGADCTPWINFDINFALDVSAQTEGEAGVCSSTPFVCVTGNSEDNLNSTSAFTWKCVGTGGEPTATCTILKPKPIFEEN